MEQPIKVSIIMLAYNVGKYIEQAIQGVVGQQTNFQIQLVIGEDRSIDNTLSICKQYEARFPNLITLVENKRNLGLQRNTLEAHRHCIGEYVAICDGDDYWTDSSKLQRMVDFMDSHPDYAICFHRVINIYETDNSKSFSNGGQKIITTITDLAKSNYITNSSSLFRHCYYQQFPNWLSEIVSSDYAIHMLNAQYGKIYYMKRSMAAYRRHKEGVWSTVNSDKQWISALKVRQQLLTYFKDNELVYEGLRMATANICLSMIRFYKHINNDLKANETRQILLTVYPEWTRKQLMDKEIIQPQPFLKRVKKRIFTIMSGIRREVSKRIPVPKGVSIHI